jgi:hypothetical protein
LLFAQTKKIYLHTGTNYAGTFYLRLLQAKSFCFYFLVKANANAAKDQR